MAEVHLGHDTRLNRDVAIKLLRSDLARDANVLTRFRREARAAGSLSHPAIVAIYDSGEEAAVESGGASVPLPYIVMEYVAGETLRAKLTREKTIEPVEAAAIVEGVLAALAYSHRMGIVHRDIKPANVMVAAPSTSGTSGTDGSAGSGSAAGTASTASTAGTAGTAGTVKVMDFGIARAVADTSATMTQTQAVIGTAQYLSPEQAQGLPVDARSDLYSTGCMLFELLTGRPPFMGESPVSVAYQHVGEPPQPPSSFQHDISPAFDTVTLHALVKDRERRYQSATEFRNDLEAARGGRPLSAAAMGTAGLAGGAAGGGVAGVLATDEETRRLGPQKRSDLVPVDGEPEDPDARERRRRPGWVYALVTLAVLAVLAGAVWGGLALFSRQAAPQLVAVPRLVGLTQAAAKAALSARQLTAQVVSKASTSVTKGQVMDQTPTENAQVAPGSAVNIDVSTGPDAAAIPNVVGQTQADATTTLQKAGFTVGTIQQVDDGGQAQGKVVSTDPAATTVTSFSSPVTLRVATGKVPVPDVRTKTFSVAQDTLQKGGLTSELQPVDDANAVEGTVLDQSPPPATIVDAGAKVTLKVARRPTAAPSTTTVTVTAPPTSVTAPPTSVTTPRPPATTTTTTTPTSPPVTSTTLPPTSTTTTTTTTTTAPPTSGTATTTTQ
jgi:beta-lactam-binding protein with PASTA domain